MTPKNWFDPSTDKWVAVRTWKSGTSKFGYSNNDANEAVKDSDSDIFNEAFGQSSVELFKRTEKTIKRGKFLWQIYQSCEV